MGEEGEEWGAPVRLGSRTSLWLETCWRGAVAHRVHVCDWPCVCGCGCGCECVCARPAVSLHDRASVPSPEVRLPPWLLLRRRALPMPLPLPWPLVVAVAVAVAVGAGGAWRGGLRPRGR